MNTNTRTPRFIDEQLASGDWAVCDTRANEHKCEVYPEIGLSSCAEACRRAEFLNARAARQAAYVPPQSTLARFVNMALGCPPNDPGGARLLAAARAHRDPHDDPDDAIPHGPEDRSCEAGHEDPDL